MTARAGRFTKERVACHYEPGAAGPTLTPVTMNGHAEQEPFGGTGGDKVAQASKAKRGKRHAHRWSVEGMTQSRQMWEGFDDIDGELYTEGGKRGNLIMLCDKDEGGCGTIKYAHPFKVMALPERPTVVMACDCLDCPTVDGESAAELDAKLDSLAWAS